MKFITGTKGSKVFHEFSSKTILSNRQLIEHNIGHIRQRVEITLKDNSFFFSKFVEKSWKIYQNSAMRVN